MALDISMLDVQHAVKHRLESVMQTLDPKPLEAFLYSFINTGSINISVRNLKAKTRQSQSSTSLPMLPGTLFWGSLRCLGPC